MSKKIRCPKCSNIIIWNEMNDVVECSQCRSAFRLRSKTESKPVLMPKAGRGQVDYLTVPTENILAGLPVLQSYIPKGWNYRCSVDMNRYDMVGNPFVISISFDAPDNSAKIIFTDECFYKHFDYNYQTAGLQYRLDDYSVSGSPSFRRLRSFSSASDYCDELAVSCGLDGLSVIGAREPENTDMTLMNDLKNNFVSQGYQQVQTDYSAKTYAGYSSNRNKLNVHTRTILVCLEKISTVPSVQMVNVGSVFGTRMMPQRGFRQVQEFFWYTPYEFTLISTQQAFDSAYSELEKIIKTMKHTQAMQQARQNAMVLAGNALAGISSTMAQSMDNRSKIINDTIDYTSNIQQQIIAGNSASHNITANLQSEMINEVNVYNGSEGVVQASTQFDHVYQSTRDPDVYAAQVGNGFDFGIEFEELKRNNGDY